MINEFKHPCVKINSDISFTIGGNQKGNEFRLFIGRECYDFSLRDVLSYLILLIGDPHMASPKGDKLKVLAEMEGCMMDMSGLATKVRTLTLNDGPETSKEFRELMAVYLERKGKLSTHL